MVESESFFESIYSFPKAFSLLFHVSTVFAQQAQLPTYARFPPFLRAVVVND